MVTGLVPEHLREVLITDYGPSQRIEDVTFSHWKEDTWQRLDYNGNVIEESENPYKILPFLPCFDYPPPGNSFWLPGGSDLIAIQEAINGEAVTWMEKVADEDYKG